jgi:hypothetical protein
MSDEAKLRAGLDSACSSGPAGGAAIGGQCTAFVGATGQILVSRVVGGARITAREERASFLGVVLKVPAAEQGACYAILLASASGRDDVILERELPEHEVVARWRGLACALGLPGLILHADGELEHLQIQIGGVIVGSTDSGRRRTQRRNRRSRFLMRRKSGRLATAISLPSVHPR